MDNMPFSVGLLDLALLGLFVLFTMRGLVRGLVPELAGVLSIVLALLLAANKSLHEAVAAFMRKLLPDPAWADLLTYLLVFLVFFILLRMLFQMLERAVTAHAPSWLDRSLGGLAGAVKGFAACTLLLVCLAYAAPDSDFRRNSLLAGHFNDFWEEVDDLSGGIQRLPKLALPRL